MAEVVGRIGISPNRPSFRLGGLRTHVAAAAYAVSDARTRGLQARVLVRIDDTNREKSRAEHVPALLGQLADVGQVPLAALGLDNAPLVVHQFSRGARYQEAARSLMSCGLAYQLPDESVVVRLSGDELVEGGRGAPNAGLVRIVRSDGTALWHLASAVDDIDYAVTVCVRGTDKLAAEPVQRALIRALGAEPPSYYYLPRLLCRDGSDLVSDFRQAGHRDITLFSYIASSILPDERRCTTFEELVRTVQPHSDLRQHVALDKARISKLERRITKSLSGEQMRASLAHYCARVGDEATEKLLCSNFDVRLLEAYARSQLEQYRLISSIATGKFESLDLGAAVPEIFEATEESPEAALRVLEACGLDKKDSYRLLRWILCGMTVGPDPTDLWLWHDASGTLHSQITASKKASKIASNFGQPTERSVTPL